MIRRLTAIVAIALALSLDLFAQTTAPRITPDVVYGHKDGLALTFDVYTPPNANGAGVLFMVSGGWVSDVGPPEGAVRNSNLLLNKGLHRVQCAPRQQLRDTRCPMRRPTSSARSGSYQVERDEVRRRSAALEPTAAVRAATVADARTDPDSGDAQSRDEVLRAPRARCRRRALSPGGLRGWTGPSKDSGARLPAPIRRIRVPILFVSSDDPPTLLISRRRRQARVPISHGGANPCGAEGGRRGHGFRDHSRRTHGFTNPEHSRRATELMVAWFERYLVRSSARAFRVRSAVAPVIQPQNIRAFATRRRSRNGCAPITIAKPSSG